MKKASKIFFKTFGCRTNIYDTQVMMENLKEHNIIEQEDKADVIVINSCTVTNGADTNVRTYINSVKRKNPKAKILFTGCGVRIKGEELYKDKKIFGLFGHSEKENINELIKEKERFFQLGDLKHIDKTIVQKMIGKSRAFIKIQEGCNFRCSYCIIPYVRGNSRSLDEKIILEQIRQIATNGFGEFILTGTNVGSYGEKTKSSLASLLKKISKIPRVKRIRLGSIEPIHLTDEFKEILDESWMAKHLHIAIQHSSDKVLALMNRRNKVKEDIKLFEFLENKGYAIGTDFIVGHPGESQKLWEEGFNNIKEYPLTHIHAFTYSKRDGTKSAQMKDIIKGDEAKKRLKKLNTLIENKNYEFRKKNKKDLDVLIENKKDDFYIGLDQFFNKISLKSENIKLKGNWVNIKNYEVLEKNNYAKI